MLLREWSLALMGALMAVAGIALLLHDHRRWRADRRATGNETATETS